MESKVCTKCGEAKPLSEFYKKSASPDGLTPSCKSCVKAASRAHYESNREERAAYYKAYQEANREKIAVRKKAYRERVAAERVEPSPTDTKTCTKCNETKPITDFHKKSAAPDGLHPSCKSCVKAERKAYREANREKIAASVKAYYESNREERAAYRKAYHAERYSNDPEYRAQCVAAGIRRQRLLASAVQEPYTREEIFERDSWTCQLCHGPIDSGLKWPESGFASIDHIVPISLGGDDTPANVQAAHLRCNLGKNARIPENGVQPGLF